MKIFLTLFLTAITTGTFAQTPDTLSIEKIMRDPKWIGVSPTNIRWSDDSKKVYFEWNPQSNFRGDSYSITTKDITPQKVNIDEQRGLPGYNGSWNKKHTLKVYVKSGNLFLEDVKTNKTTQLITTSERLDNPAFNAQEDKVLFTDGNNLFSLKLNGGGLEQLTNFVKAASKAEKKDADDTDQSKWLKAQQLELFNIIKLKHKDEQMDSVERKSLQPKKLKELITDGRDVDNVGLSPDGRYITYRLTKQPDDAKVTIVPDYVTSSGFTEDIPNRTKVGAPQPSSESYIYDRQRDSVYKINTSAIPSIKDIPAYIKDYPGELAKLTKLNADREVTVNQPLWSEDGKYAVVIVDAMDYKDRWIMKLDEMTGNLTLLDRQHNDAWISGGAPGIDDGTIGWLDAAHIYYQSESSGYSHIYVADVTTGDKKQLTSGKWEVQNLQLSNDKKTFYFNANIEQPGNLQFYRLPAGGGEPVKLTSIKGENDVLISPDEKWLAIHYSYNNKPWELYLQHNSPAQKRYR